MWQVTVSGLGDYRIGAVLERGEEDDDDDEEIEEDEDMNAPNDVAISVYNGPTRLNRISIVIRNCTKKNCLA